MCEHWAACENTSMCGTIVEKRIELLMRLWCAGFESATNRQSNLWTQNNKCESFRLFNDTTKKNRHTHTTKCTWPINHRIVFSNSIQRSYDIDLVTFSHSLFELFRIRIVSIMMAVGRSCANRYLHLFLCFAQTTNTWCVALVTWVTVRQCILWNVDCGLWND